MILEYVRYQIPASDDSAFRAGWARALVLLRTSPECGGAELSQCVEEPTRYVVRLSWVSKQAHTEAFRRSSLFDTFVQNIGQFVPYIEEMKHYEVLDAGWTRAGVADASNGLEKVGGVQD